MIQETDTSTKGTILDYIVAYIRRHGYGPTYREIMDACDLSSTSVVKYHVDHLVQDGKLTRRDGSRRTLQVSRAAISHTIPQGEGG